MKGKEWVLVIAIIIVVAVLTSFITSSFTGNVVKVPTVGSGFTELTINEGQSKATILQTINGPLSFIFYVNGITSGSASVAISGGGVWKTIREGTSVNFVIAPYGTITVYAKSIFYSAKAGTINYAILDVSASGSDVYTKSEVDNLISTTLNNVSSPDIASYFSKCTVVPNAPAGNMTGNELCSKYSPYAFLITLNESQSMLVNVNGANHTISIIGIDSTGKVSVSVDNGTIRQIASGTSAKVGTIVIYIQNSFYSSRMGTTNWAQLVLGNNYQCIFALDAYPWKSGNMGVVQLTRCDKMPYNPAEGFSAFCCQS